MPSKSIWLKLLVDRDRNRIVFVESDKDFVDILFSFLTLPIGKIVRLSGKQSELGCMDTLYKSVEDVDVMQLQTEACKDMLLRPASAAEEEYFNLAIDFDNTKRFGYYICPTWTCVTETHGLVSTVRNARCRCGKRMSKELNRSKWNGDAAAASNLDGVFIKGSEKFMITDGLEILPISTTACLALLKKLGIREGTALEERVVSVTVDQVLHLLKHSLLSKTALSDTFLPEADRIVEVDLGQREQAPKKKETSASCEKLSMKPQQSKLSKGSYMKVQEDCVSFLAYLLGSVVDQLSRNIVQMQRGIMGRGKMSLKLLRHKSEVKVFYAEAEEDFIDLLFSFLTFPLGFLPKIFNRHSSVGCLDNLYDSVEDLGDHMRSEKHKSMLVSPKLAPYFGSKNQLLQISEEAPWKLVIPKCNTCYHNGIRPNLGKCLHKLDGCKTQLRVMNPKSLEVETKSGGGFMKGPGRFLVTDDLHVEPLSVIAGISVTNKFKLSMSDLEEWVVSVGEEEALSLLKASLSSETALTDVFLRF